MYINPNDLKEIVQDYFTGNLNNAEPYIDNLYKDIAHLHPTNTLWGKVTMEEFRAIYKSMEEVERLTIKYVYMGDETSYERLVEKYTEKGCYNKPIEDYITNHFLTAYTHLEIQLLTLC